MKTFVEQCFLKLRERDETFAEHPLVKSMVTDIDILTAEDFFECRFSVDFKEFLKSFILPRWTCLLGTFCGEDWVGSNKTFSKEINDYLYFPDIPENPETTTIEFSLNGIWEISDLTKGSLIENIQRLTWNGAAKFSYILLGEFLDYILFLDCKSETIVYVDHDYLSPKAETREEIEEEAMPLFHSFNDMFRCLFLGEICNGETGKLTGKIV